MPVWQNRATFRRLGVWIHWWRRSYGASPKNDRIRETLTASHSKLVHNSILCQHFPKHVIGCRCMVTLDPRNAAGSGRM